MFGRYKRRRKVRGNGNLWVEGSESMSGAGIPDTDLEQEEKEKEEEEERKNSLKEHKVVEVAVNNRKGERKQFYEAMLSMQEFNLNFYINERVATIVLQEDNIDDTLAALEAVGLTDFGVYGRHFDPNQLG